MEISNAVGACGALAQESRLKIFRLLVQCGPDGMAAGDIARRLKLPQNTLSFHVAILSRARLVASRKVGRSIIYFVDLEGTRDLLSFLVEDCCGGKAELCGPLIASAEAQLLSRVRRRTTMQVVSSNPPLNVLFLCTGNSARSIMAECIMNRLGLGKFKAYSAGSYPKGAVNPHALAVLRKSNFDVSQLRSKSWDEFAGPDASKLDFVFTVCDDAAKEVCPLWPGQPMSAHWGLPDPAKAQGTEAEQGLAFADCFRMLYQRISIFVSLPFDKLTKLSLQKHLDEIGQTKDAATTRQSA
jgi:protein-tyrosine-phosphatase/DNA-binding transcriptional ArsR family regulator